MEVSPTDVVALPVPRQDGPVAIEVALAQRRSVRRLVPAAVTLNEVSQLLWSAQGVTDQQGHRTTPSAGALYPLEIYLIAGDLTMLDAGVFKYIPHGHALRNIARSDQLAALVVAAWEQSWMGDASCVLAIAADFNRTAVKYGERAERYVHMEAGHAAQNVCLQAAALGLSTTMVGAFRDAEVKELIGMEAAESPLCLLPIGRIVD